MNLEEALEKLEEARDGGDSQTTANLLFRIGCLMARKNEYEQALEALQEAYDICRVQGNDTGRLAVVKRVVPLLLTLNRLEAGRAGIETGLALADKLSDLSARLGLLMNSADLAQRESRLGEAVKALAEAVDICREHDDTVGEILVLEKMGPILRTLKQSEAALQVYERLVDLARKAGDVSRHGLALVGVGQLSRELGRDEEGLESLVLAEKVYLSAGLKVWADKVREEILRIEETG